MPDEMAPYLVRGPLAGPAAPSERVIAAYQIPYLPDVLVGRDLGEQERREAARGVLDAQVTLIAALARSHGHAFSLRYLFLPERGSVTIALLLRADVPAGQAPEAMARLGDEVTRLLARDSIPTTPVVAEREAVSLLNPPGYSYIAEIRQHEELVPLRMGDAYVVTPFQPTLSTWLATFDRLVRQQAPCLINVHLEPTRLLPMEREAFEQAASLARGLKDFQYEGYTGQINLADPLANTVAVVYDDTLRRLTVPLLMVIQVASPVADTVMAVTDALVRDVSLGIDIHTSDATGQRPSGCDVTMPQSAQDALAAHHTLSQLELRPWGVTHASPPQYRLRFLADARTASAAFRFPLPSRAGIPGVEVRTSGWGRRKIFLSYRRGDSAGMTGRIYDRLVRRFGKEAIYMDVAAIPLGTDFTADIRTALDECSVQLVIIGPQWVESRDAAGARRLDSPGDYVRIEVEAGLTSGMVVIPLLVDGATMPSFEVLPASLADLQLRNGQLVRHADFDHDMAAVIAAIEEEMRRMEGMPK